MDFYTAAEIARRMGVTRQYVYKLVLRGELTGLQLGSVRVFGAREVDAFVERRDQKRRLKEPVEEPYSNSELHSAEAR